MTKRRLTELAGEAIRGLGKDGYDSEDIGDFVAGQINDALDRVQRELYLCKADRCSHCDKKIRIIEGFKIL